MRQVHNCSVKKALPYLQTVAYYGISLTLTALLVFTCPIWMPIYFFFTSLHKSYLIVRTVLRLPLKLLSKQTQIKTPQYAILRGNGKYLQNTDENFLAYQLYDYTVRKFLTISSFDLDMKIAELEAADTVGLQYLHRSCRIHEVKALSSTSKRTSKRYGQPVSIIQSIPIEQTNYQIVSFPETYDCIICFSLKQKLSPAIDILKVLTYIKYHLAEDGYVVFGEYLQDEQVKALRELFQVYGMKVYCFEDITKNIVLADKINRKRMEETQYDEFWLEQIRQKVRRIAGFQNKFLEHGKYYVFILERN